MDEDYYDNWEPLDDLEQWELNQLAQDREYDVESCEDCDSDSCAGCENFDPCRDCDCAIDCRDCRVYQENREEPDYGPYDGGYEEPDFCDTVPEDAYGDCYMKDEDYFNG